MICHIVMWTNACFALMCHESLINSWICYLLMCACICMFECYLRLSVMWHSPLIFWWIVYIFLVMCHRSFYGVGTSSNKWFLCGKESNKPYSQRIVFKVQSLKQPIWSNRMGIQELQFAMGDSECADVGENALYLQW